MMIQLAPVRRHAIILVLLLASCKRSNAQSETGDPRAQAEAPPAPPPPAGRAIVMVGGEERMIEAAEAQKQGLTLVSLRDDWTPYIFTEIPGPDGKPLPNRYRTIYLGLASDQTDLDGQPLVQSPDKKAGKKRKGAAPPPPAAALAAGPPAPLPHNYLEVYGIPPTLSVLRARFLEDAPDEHGNDRCSDVNRDKLAEMAALGAIPTVEPKEEKRWQKKLEKMRRELEQKRRQAGAATLEDLAATQPRAAADIKLLQREALGHLVWPEVEKRLQCENMFAPKAKHNPGHFDDAMREAVARFQRKHKLYDAPALRKETIATMAKTLLENDQVALERVLTERAVAAANVLEDGSVDRQAPRKKGEDPATPREMIAPTYKNAAGESVPVRNLVKEAADATIQQLGLTKPEASLAFFKRHPASDFQWLEAAVKIAPPPEYYGREMELAVEIDRGDVFYDPPYDPQTGKPNPQNRQHYPRLTVRARWNNQWIPLVRWRTTIGGWRSDLAANGYEYYRYKGSDVGPRAWKQIVAGPVWIAPPSTPIRTLVKSKSVHGAWQTVVNYDEVGPGYLSAYGLVAAYNVVPGKEGKPDWDNGIRVHGSSEFRSMFDPDGYSHGCHRLVNHLAERMFSWILQHHHAVPEGDQKLGFSRQWLWKEDVMEMRLPTRGFRFSVDPPIPVNVLEGTILGTIKKPIKEYVPKPGVQYPPGPVPVPPDSPEARAGGGAD
jgi:hypothetical protein